MAKDEVRVSYVVEMTEYERGWGQRPDGYMAFLTEDAANEYITEQTKDRTGSAPDVYVNYSKVGYRETNPKFLTSIKKSPSKRIYFDRMNELK